MSPKGPAMRSMLDHYGAKKMLSVSKHKEGGSSHSELPMIKPALRTAASGSKASHEGFNTYKSKKNHSRVESPKPVMLIQQNYYD